MGFRYTSIAAHEHHLDIKAGRRKANKDKIKADKSRSKSRQSELLIWLERKAENMRQKPTAAESKVKQLLIDSSIFYLFQKSVAYRAKEQGVLILKGYIIDFYLPGEQIIIEVDGEYHDNQFQQVYDRVRDNRLIGICPKHVLRLKNNEVMDNLFNLPEALKRCKTSTASLKIEERKETAHIQPITKKKENSILAAGPIVRKRRW